MVGVFWIYKDKIYSKKQSIKFLSPLNGFIDSNFSHYEVWEEFKQKFKEFYLYEYEEINRGRVVYNQNKNEFVVYSNSYVIKNYKDLIIKDFKLRQEKVIFEVDEHYLLTCI